MKFRRSVAQLDLVSLLLVMAALELVLNRLAVPVLRPTGQAAPPGWHKNLDQVGLFVFHLATTLALGVVAHELWVRVRRGAAPPLARVFLGAAGVVMLVGAVWAIAQPATPRAAFVLEAGFVAVLLGAAALLGAARAPWPVLVAYGLIALPFVLHFYGTLRLSVLPEGDAARWSNLPERVRDAGQHAVALAAILAPVLLGPRPLIMAMVRPAPMVLSAFVAAVTAVILRRHYEVGMELAQRGLGVELGPAAPPETMAIWVAAAAAAVWTIASGLLADAPARRRLGVGFALVVVAGYGFAWPLMYLCATVGLLALVEGGEHVRDEEKAGVGTGFRAPPIPEAIWQAYTRQLALALDAPAVRHDGSGLDETSYTTTRAAGGLAHPVTVRLTRRAGVLEAIDVEVGGEAGGSPGFTLLARPEAHLAVGQHPPPPPCPGPIVRTGDRGFDRRFQLVDATATAVGLLDEGWRARAAASLDGWLAVWPGRRVHLRVHPGRGAPLDHPVPVTELAFRAPASPPVDRLVAVVDLVTELAARAPAPAELT